MDLEAQESKIEFSIKDQVMLEEIMTNRSLIAALCKNLSISEEDFDRMYEYAAKIAHEELQKNLTKHKDLIKYN